MEYFTEIRHIAEQLKICDDVVSESMQAFHMMRGFPKTAEWTAFKNTLNMTKNDTKPDDLLKHLEVFESTLREVHGVSRDVALFAKRGNKYEYNKQGVSRRKDPSNTENRTRHDEKDIEFYGCGKQGHMKNQCRSRKQWNTKDHASRNTSSSTGNTAHVISEGDVEDMLFVAQETSKTGSACNEPNIDIADVTLDPAVPRPADWIVDSGATSHVTGKVGISFNYRACHPGERIIKVADNRYLPVNCTGDVVVAFKPHSVVLLDVLHVKEFGAKSLLSVYRLLLAGYEVKLGLENTAISCRKTHLLIAEGGPAHGGLFHFIAGAAVANFVGEDTAMHSAGIVGDQLLLWHNRLGHLSLRTVRKLPGMVEGIKESHLKNAAGTPDTCACEACIIGKLAQKPFTSLLPAKRSTRAMELIHSDVVGPIQVRRHGGKRYAIAFTNDFSHWSEIHFMTEKSEVPEKFKLFKAKMSTYDKIARLRTDGGGEYASNHFKAYLQEEGITHDITAPYSTASNGVSQRTN